MLHVLIWIGMAKRRLAMTAEAKTMVGLSGAVTKAVAKMQSPLAETRGAERPRTCA